MTLIKVFEPFPYPANDLTDDQYYDPNFYYYIYLGYLFFGLIAMCLTNTGGKLVF